MTSVRVVALMATVLFVAGCRDGQTTPAWLEVELKQIAGEPVSNPPTVVFRYRYRGEVVYYRPPRCCDVFGELYDESGETLCFPDGGITGRGDGRCNDFFATRSDCEVVWSDPRAKPGRLLDCAGASANEDPAY